MLIFLPAHLLWGMGAGDVKLMAGVGLFLGPEGVFWASIYVMVTGGLIGLILLVQRGGVLRLLRRYLDTLRCLFTTGHFVYIPPAPDEPAASRFPYAVAILLGTVLFLLTNSELYFR
jgi:prepilin peptidase CpaA